MWRRGRRPEEDFAREIDAHIEAETDRLIADGVNPAEARTAARRAFGNVLTARERFYRSRHVMWLDDARRDLRYAIRSLRRAPWYSLTVIGVIALGMALATTVLAVVDATLFKSLPYRAPNQLFAASPGYSRLPDSTAGMGSVGVADFRAFAEALPEATLTAFALESQPMGKDERAASADVDAAFFNVVGTAPAIGGFQPGDFDTSAPLRPAIITHGLWVRAFASDPSVIGRTLVGDGGQGIRVVGVMPANFVFPTPAGRGAPEMLTPLILPAPAVAGPGLFWVLVRLPQGLPRAEASRRLTVAAGAIAAARPPQPPMPNAPDATRIRMAGPDTLTLQPLRDVLLSRFHQTSWIAFSSATLLILLASANVTGVAVARLQDRWRDLVLRRSLGARSLDLLRLLLFEHAALVLLGTAAGVSAAWPLLALTLRLMPANVLFLKTPAVDLRVIGFSILTALCCVVLVTIMPARAALRAQARATLLDGGTTTRRARRGRSWIVAAQVAMAVVMAVGGTLVAGSLIRVWSEDPGFDVDRTAVVTVLRPGASAGAIETLVADVRHVPGVAEAGGIDKLVLEHALDGSAFDPPPGIPNLRNVESLAVTTGFFEAAGLRPTAGRTPTAPEFEGGAHVVVVSRLVAQMYWPGRPAVGQVLSTKGTPFVVVGVVPDARYLALDFDPRGSVYLPLAAKPQPGLDSILITFDRSGRTTVPGIVAWITKQCPDCRVLSGDTMTDKLGASIRPREFNAWFFASFGVAAVMIVGIGILGLVAMTTSQRTKEIGIRTALGATPGTLVRQIVQEQVAAVVFGLLIGGVLAAWAVRFVTTYLYKLPVSDPRAWSAAVAAVLLAAVVGGLIPAQRASRIDPIRALRVD